MQGPGGMYQKRDSEGISFKAESGGNSDVDL